MTRDEQIQFLLRLNEEHSREFSDPGVRDARRHYRVKHPTEIAVLKCMDGRIHMPVATKTPLGVLQPFRNLGGQFHIGWPHFQSVLRDWKEYALSRGRKCLVLVTYHFSAGDAHRGCAGFGYDTESAIRFTHDLKGQIESVFGRGHQFVHPIQVGFETDYDALVLHGENGERVDLSRVERDDDASLRALLERLYPGMLTRIQEDFIPLLRGNIHHTRAVRDASRPIESAEHREFVLGIGRGFDWFHLANRALLIGPWAPNMSEPILTAAKIIKQNMDSGRIPNQSAVLLTSGIYRERAGDEPLLARAKALHLRDLAQEAIRSAYPDLAEVLTPLPVIVDMETRRMQIVRDDSLPIL